MRILTWPQIFVLLTVIITGFLSEAGSPNAVYAGVFMAISAAYMFKLIGSES